MPSFLSRLGNAAKSAYYMVKNTVRIVVLALLWPIATPLILLWRYLGDVAMTRRYVRLTKILKSERYREQYFFDQFRFGRDKEAAMFLLTIAKDPTEYLSFAINELISSSPYSTMDISDWQKQTSFILEALQFKKIDIQRIFKIYPNLIISLSAKPTTLEIIKYLIEDPIVKQNVFPGLSKQEIFNKTLMNGKTALFCACKNGSPDLVDYLLSAGANANVECKPYDFGPEKYVPLLAALTNNFFYKFNNWRQYIGRLIEKTNKQFIEQVVIFPDKGPHGDRYVSTLYMLSPNYQEFKEYKIFLAEDLIKAGADVNIIIKPSKTLLDLFNDKIAVSRNISLEEKETMSGYKKMCKLLEENGAKTFVQLQSEPGGALQKKGSLAFDGPKTNLAQEEQKPSPQYKPDGPKNINS